MRICRKFAKISVAKINVAQINVALINAFRVYQKWEIKEALIKFSTKNNSKIQSMDRYCNQIMAMSER